MNETNGSLSNGSTNGSHSTSAAEFSSVDVARVNGQTPAIPVESSFTSVSAAEPEARFAPPVEKVLDENLDEDDLKIAITVTVHGRKAEIMKRAFEKTFYDGLVSTNRGLLFKALRTFLEEEIHQAVAVKINRKVPYVMPEQRSNGPQGKGKSQPGFEPIPPYISMDESDESSLHTPPTDCHG
jgi:hypothetical protein